MQIKEITNKKIWDTFVKQNSHFSFFQSWDWGKVEEKTGKKIWRAAIINSKKQIVGASQIIKIKAKRGDFLHVRHGPIFVNWDKKTINEWLTWIKNIAKKEHVSFIRISPRISVQKTEILQKFKKLGFGNAPIHNMDAEISYVVDLKKKEEELLKNMRKNTRNLIRKAIKIGVKITKSNSEKNLKKFAEIFDQTANRSGFISSRNLQEEFDVFSKNNSLLVILAEYDKQILAGAVIIFSYNQAIYHYAASSSKMRNIPAAYLVQWEAILEAKKRGLDYYNLWGGVSSLDDPSHPWYGLTLFKSGFGGEIMENIHAQDLPLSSAYRTTYFLEKLIKYIRGYEKFFGLRSPSWLRRLIGV